MLFLSGEQVTGLFASRECRGQRTIFLLMRARYAGTPMHLDLPGQKPKANMAFRPKEWPVPYAERRDDSVSHV